MAMTFDQFAAVRGDSSDVLGKILYYSLSSILVERADLERICMETGFPNTASSHVRIVDAFRSATGDIYDRKAEMLDGTARIFKIYCRDNRGDKATVSRELVKETLNQQTNHYEKLANISYDKADGAKRRYEQVLRQELAGLDDEFSTLKFMAQELQTRANNIRLQKKPRREKIDQTEIGLFQAA